MQEETGGEGLRHRSPLARGQRRQRLEGHCPKLGTPEGIRGPRSWERGLKEFSLRASGKN